MLHLRAAAGSDEQPGSLNCAEGILKLLPGLFMSWQSSRLQKRGPG